MQNGFMRFLWGQMGKAQALTEWDKRLLSKHLDFYIALEKGYREPTTEMQRRFIQVSQGSRAPQTQHEIAFSRYRAIIPARDPIKEIARVADSVPSNNSDPNIDPEFVIDAIEEVEFASPLSKATKGLFEQVKTRLKQTAGTAAKRSTDTALWISALASDRDWSDGLARALGEQFNTLSSVYSRSMDGGFAKGLQTGQEYISPWIHRIVDGNHTPIGAIAAAREALTDDTQWEEFIGGATAYFSDLSSVAGMPVVTISQESIDTVQRLFESIDPTGLWVVDAATFNMEELISSAVPAIAVLLNWNRVEQDEFKKMLGGMTTAAIYSANPILALLVIASAARAFLLHKKQGSLDMRRVAKSFAEGGILSGSLIATGTIVGGPVWVGMLAGLVVVASLQGLARKFNPVVVTQLLLDVMPRQVQS